MPLAIDPFAPRDRGELVVRSFLFVEVGGEEPHNVIVTQRFRPGNEGAIASDFVVLDGLRGAHYGGIEDFFVGDLACDLVPLADQTVDRGAFDAFGLLA